MYVTPKQDVNCVSALYKIVPFRPLEIKELNNDTFI